MHASFKPFSPSPYAGIDHHAMRMCLVLDRACTTNARYDAVQFVADGGLQSTKTFEYEASVEAHKPVIGCE